MTIVAVVVAELYLTPGEDPAYAPRGRVLLAQIAVGQGRWQAAHQQLRALALTDPDLALITEASLALTPDVPVGDAGLRELRARLRAAPSDRGYGEVTPVWASAARVFLAGMLSARLGDEADAKREAAVLATPLPGDSGVRGDFAALLRAEIARQHGAALEGLAELDRFRYKPETVLGAFIYQIPPVARFLKARLLLEAGEDDEAVRWLASFPDPAGTDLQFLAAAAVREGAVFERRGRRREALASYALAERTWAPCEPAFEPVRARVVRALDRLRALPDSASRR